MEGKDVKEKGRASTDAIMLQFGGQLCFNLQGILEKTKAKLENGGKCGNIRLLGPLVLLCEYISEVNQGDAFAPGNVDTESFLESLNAFWSAIASVAKYHN